MFITSVRGPCSTRHPGTRLGRTSEILHHHQRIDTAGGERATESRLVPDMHVTPSEARWLSRFLDGTGSCALPGCYEIAPGNVQRRGLRDRGSSSNPREANGTRSTPSQPI
jgi:hypothetical protein